MSADKRTVTTDALATLGSIIDASQKRDAIHLAVEPVIAGERLRPGDHIIIEGSVAVAADIGKGLGIVDPFLVNPVKKGERFWFIMYPRMITSLRHVWAHPAFVDEPGTPAPVVPAVNPVAQAKRRIEEIAASFGADDEGDLTYDRLMNAAREHVETEYGYLVQQGGDDWQDKFPDLSDEFWRLFQIVTGSVVPEDKKHSFFSCSC